MFPLVETTLYSCLNFPLFAIRGPEAPALVLLPEKTLPAIHGGVSVVPPRRGRDLRLKGHFLLGIGYLFFLFPEVLPGSVTSTVLFHSPWSPENLEG